MPQKKKLYYHVKKTTDLSSLPKIQGIDFSKKQTISSVIQSFATTGFQASELAKAITIVQTMIREKASIYLSFTSNIISSGLRESVMHLTKTKKVHVLCTAAGGIEEDAIKAIDSFYLGSFTISGTSLFEEGVGRIGNIYAKNDEYAKLELFMQKVFTSVYTTQQKTGRAVTPSQIAREIGRLLEVEKYNYTSSYLYWAYKNGIPVYCPGIIDGAIGDFAYYFKQKHPDFVIDVTQDHKAIIDYTLQQEKTGGIILGGGISKHYVLNANIFKEGFDYTVYISTAQGFDGSDSGGNVEEAKSWAKIKIHTPSVKVFCDATICFPLLVLESFEKKK